MFSFVKNVSLFIICFSFTLNANDITDTAVCSCDHNPTHDHLRDFRMNGQSTINSLTLMECSKLLLEYAAVRKCFKPVCEVREDPVAPGTYLLYVDMVVNYRTNNEDVILELKETYKDNGSCI